MFKHRAWMTDPRDQDFLLGLPEKAAHWLRTHVAPLDSESGEFLWERLFKGCGKPFHFLLATGWMRDALHCHQGTSARYLSSEFTQADLDWDNTADVYLVRPNGAAYQAQWQLLRSALFDKQIWRDSVVFCMESSKWALVFWEESGPIRVNRGKRSLLPAGDSRA